MNDTTNPVSDAIKRDLAKLAQARVCDAIDSVTDLAADAEQVLIVVIGAHSATMAALSTAYDHARGNPLGTTDPIDVATQLQSILKDEIAEREAARAAGGSMKGHDHV